MKRLLPILTMVAGILSACTGPSVAGTWIGDAEVDGETQRFILTLEVDGASLSGTLDRGQGSVEIQEGTVDGVDFSFLRFVQTPFGEIRVPYDGRVDGDTLTLDVWEDAEDGFTVVLMRQT